MNHKPVSMHKLAGERITQVTHGAPSGMFPGIKPYNAYTLNTESGKTFVVWNSMGETNMNEVTA